MPSILSTSSSSTSAARRLLATNVLLRPRRLPDRGGATPSLRLRPERRPSAAFLTLRHVSLPPSRPTARRLMASTPPSSAFISSSASASSSTTVPGAADASSSSSLSAATASSAGSQPTGPTGNRDGPSALSSFASSASSEQQSQQQEPQGAPTVTCTPYEHWVRRLYTTNLFQPVKMGLSNIQKLHDLMGRPMDDPGLVVVHVAGTNGKGSVALKVARTLERSGIRTGIFVSPHVSSFRERMQVDSRMIAEEQVVRLLPEVYRMCSEHDIPATFFEIATALAFLFYREERCRAVVLETGLGGRLDATNVVSSPAVSVITSIGLEHTRILGDTVEKIAAEKAGIIKAGRPVLVGPNVPHAVLRQCAIDKRASRYCTVEDVLGPAPALREDVDPADYDVENTRIAAAALKLVQQEFPDVLGDLSDETIRAGTSVRPPCRFEVFTVPDPDGAPTSPSPLTVILDVAHNPPAMQYMARKLRRTYPDEKIRVVVGMSSDKDMRLCGEALLEAVQGNQSRIHLAEAAHPRAATLEAILDATGLVGARHDLERRSVTDQMADAMRLARRNGELLVVCGSVFLMAEAREALGIDEPRDSACIAEVAGAGFRHSQENFGNATTTDSVPVAV